MDNLINFERYLNSSIRKVAERDDAHATKSADILFFTGVRVEYENKEVFPAGSSSQKSGR